MPRPKNQKEVKQFLGLIGYYRKFVPRFADISRVLNKLTHKDEEFKWTPECDKCFNMLKDYLQEAPILRYPDPEARYVLYTDTSKYAYAGVLTQTVDGTDHPIAYVSGLFRGSQLNWAALTKEAYAIYMSVKKLSFYLDSARITVRSNHLPPKKFLEKNTMNAKVNNWAVELESQKIDFVFILGIKNVLADTLSRLIEVDNDVKLPEEKEGEEFGYIPFEKLPPAQVEVCEEVWINEVTQDRVTLKLQDPIQQNIEINLPLTNQKMKELQEQDPKVSHLRKLWSESKLNKTLFTMENDILKRVLMVNGLLYKPVVTPSILKDCLIMLAHDEKGHNGFKRTYGSPDGLLLERYEKTNTVTLQEMQNLRKTQCHSTRVQQRTFCSTNSTYGIHSNGPDRRIPPCIKQRKSLCLDCNLYVNRFYFLHTTEKQDSRGGRQSLLEPHLLCIWPF